MKDEVGLSLDEFLQQKPNASQHEIMDWMNSATLEQLQIATSQFAHNARLAEYAKSTLQIRLQGMEVELAKKHIDITDKLTKQTEILISESKGISELTKVLIWLTVSLGVFAVVQIILMVFDIWKHK